MVILSFYVFSGKFKSSFFIDKFFNIFYFREIIENVNAGGAYLTASHSGASSIFAKILIYKSLAL